MIAGQRAPFVAAFESSESPLRSGWDATVARLSIDEVDMKVSLRKGCCWTKGILYLFGDLLYTRAFRDFLRVLG